MPFDPIDGFFSQSSLPFAFMKWRFDGVLAFIRANMPFCDRLRTDQDAIKGKTFEDILAGLPVADRIPDVALAELRSGRSIEFTVRAPADGIALRIGAFSLGGDHVACVMLDSPSDRIGDELVGFVEATGDIVCIADRHAVIVKVNRRFAETVGRRAEDLVGTDLLALAHRDDAVSAGAAWRDVGSGAITDYVIRFDAADGTVHEIEWTARVVGNLVFVVGRDATGETARKLEIEREANTDALTGLYNRRYFYRRIRDEMDRADRLDRPLSVILADIDHFKNVNDTWGHPIGDEVLARVAHILGDGVRKSDTVARIGGEEFVILMPDCPIDRAAAIAERLRQTLADRPMPIVGTMTASFGVTAMERQESPRSLYRRVDAAMYMAKQRGRNRVVTKTFVDDETIEAAPAYFAWKREWESGDAVIDAQHRKLIALGLEFAAQVQRDPAHLPDLHLASAILIHASSHFTTEEEILRRNGYPGLEAHRAIHAGLLAKAKELADGLAAGTVRAALFIVYLIDDILIGHMLDEDVKFFPALAERRANTNSHTTGGSI